MYSQSESRKESNKRRDESDKGKASRKRYAQSDHGKAKIAQTTSEWKELPGVRAQLSMRERIRRLVKNPDYKSDRAQLIIRIESQFLPGMSWSNYGYRDGDYVSGWDIDHVIPVAEYDHNNPEDIARCWNILNFAPMWHTSNLQKGSSSSSYNQVPTEFWPTSWNGSPPTTC